MPPRSLEMTLPRPYIASSHAQLTTCFQQENVLDIVKTCHSEAGGDVCLVCPVKLSSTADVLWTRGNSSIYAGTNKLVRDVNLRINSCSTDLSSLRISNVTIKNVNEKYYCQRITNAEWNAGFILDIIGKPVVTITKESIHASDKDVQILMCKADGVLEPITLTWLVNGNVEGTDIFHKISNHSVSSRLHSRNDFRHRPEDASRNDWCEFRVFSQYLRNMPKHMNIVDIVGCDTEKVPHYIYMEYLTNGTLLDFLLDTSKENDYSTAIYDKRIRPFSLTRDARQLATFSSQILEALMFLETVDCDHLGICARKVLLDNNTNCKLYDFNLCSATTKILSNINLEVSPCLKWFAPETIVNREYSQNSNIWSYAVFMWEVFSMGKTPFEKLDLEGLKSAINIQPPLPQKQQLAERHDDNEYSFYQ
ncbi:putative nerve growth factor receptor TRKA [Apostichopus japonicus]|uniref:Putative nerve growth factor receptor TRKA n=1 Tax=Stichopus japonicus TaxID=307972 RepID=A0A2G8LKG2_STIJA|nr:putative nerve growth factor receptor TRKA [Apostichopus japonicus]